mgnify:CR=1 FL=1
MRGGSLNVLPEAGAYMQDQSSQIKILYEDNHLLAIDKPWGLLTQPSRSSTDSMEERAKAYIKETRGKPGKVFLHAVHRLDRVAAGITLFALTDKALSRMNEQMRSHEITRTYHAAVTGQLSADQGTLVHYLKHSRLMSKISGEHEAGAQRSVLDYRVIFRKNRMTLVEVALVTGRYHQIRAQLSAEGCPIVGDTLYGSRAAFTGNAIALMHKEMRFIHPVLKEMIIISADYPDGWPLPRG